MLGSASYRKLREGLMDDEDEDLHRTYEHARLSSPRKAWQDYLVFPMTLVILALSSVIVYQHANTPACGTSLNGECRRSQLDPAIDEPFPNHVRFISKYSSKDSKGMAAVDEAWDAIAPSVGTVGLDDHLAASLGLPASDRLQSDPSKGVYVLEAYHAVHCLKVIRSTLFQLARGEKLTVPFGHSTHCVAGILQHIVCNADDTLLFYKEGISTGDGQARTCRNWGALRDWAGNNSACFLVDEIATQHEDLSRTRCVWEDGIDLGAI